MPNGNVPGCCGCRTCIWGAIISATTADNSATTGEVSINDRNQFLTGGGFKAVFALTDAIYTPLAARQLYRARNYEVQAAKNDALLSVTEAFFSVQQARGILAGDEDTVAKGRELVKRSTIPRARIGRADRDSAGGNHAGRSGATSGDFRDKIGGSVARTYPECCG